MPPLGFGIFILLLLACAAASTASFLAAEWLRSRRPLSRQGARVRASGLRR